MIKRSKITLDHCRLAFVEKESGVMVVTLWYKKRQTVDLQGALVFNSRQNLNKYN